MWKSPKTQIKNSKLLKFFFSLLKKDKWYQKIIWKVLFVKKMDHLKNVLQGRIVTLPGT